jgi:hypothetical protein
LYFCGIALAVYDLLTWSFLLKYRCWKARDYYDQLVDFDTALGKNKNPTDDGYRSLGCMRRLEYD